MLWQSAVEHSPQDRAAELAFYLQIPAVSASAETESCRQLGWESNPYSTQPDGLTAPLFIEPRAAKQLSLCFLHARFHLILHFATRVEEGSLTVLSQRPLQLWIHSMGHEIAEGSEGPEDINLPWGN